MPRMAVPRDLQVERERVEAARVRNNAERLAAWRGHWQQARGEPEHTNAELTGEHKWNWIKMLAPPCMRSYMYR
jgi:hypothetical protein